MRNAEEMFGGFELMKRPSDEYYRELPDRLGDQLSVSEMFVVYMATLLTIPLTALSRYCCLRYERRSNTHLWRSSAFLRTQMTRAFCFKCLQSPLVIDQPSLWKLFNESVACTPPTKNQKKCWNDRDAVALAKVTFANSSKQ